MIDVGGFRMHLYCAGEGPLTVILDSGLSDTWLHWNKVQPEWLSSRAYVLMTVPDWAGASRVRDLVLAG